MISVLAQASHCALRHATRKTFIPSPVLYALTHSSRTFASSSACKEVKSGWGTAFGSGSQKLPRSPKPLPSTQLKYDPTSPTWKTIFAPLLDLHLGNKTDRSAEGIWSEREQYEVPYMPEPPTAYAGRTVDVKQSPQGNDFGFAFTKLGRILRNNKVRRELRLQARHEKSGVKRRRLRSERWRKRFAHEVRLKVQLVQEIRARGA